MLAVIRCFARDKGRAATRWQVCQTKPTVTSAFSYRQNGRVRLSPNAVDKSGGWHLAGVLGPCPISKIDALHKYWAPRLQWYCSLQAATPRTGRFGRLAPAARMAGTPLGAGISGKKTQFRRRQKGPGDYPSPSIWRRAATQPGRAARTKRSRLMRPD